MKPIAAAIAVVSVLAITATSLRAVEPAKEAAPASGSVVYHHDFETTPADDGKWSKRDTDKAPKSGRRYLGGFGPGEVTLTLRDLPAHRRLRVSYDVLFARSWDGSNAWGPDIWECSTAEGHRLVYATFTNCGVYTNNNQQSFPENYPGGPHLGWTGATETQTLGYSWGVKYGKEIVDSVYHLDLVFPHDADGVELRFISHCKDSKSDQFWGLDNVRVEVLEDMGTLSDAAFEQDWATLATHEPFAVREAIWRMINAGDRSVELLGARFDRIIDAAENAEKLIDRLADDSESVRQAAVERLRLAGLRALPKLIAARNAASDDAIRRQLDRLVTDAAWNDIDAGHGRRLRRVLDVLRAINSDAANALRKKLEPPAQTGLPDLLTGSGDVR